MFVELSKTCPHAMMTDRALLFAEEFVFEFLYPGPGFEHQPEEIERILINLQAFIREEYSSTPKNNSGEDHLLEGLADWW